MLLKYLCSTKKHSNMTIMSTSMHFTRDFALVLPLNSFLSNKSNYVLILHSNSIIKFKTKIIDLNVSNRLVINLNRQSIHISSQRDERWFSRADISDNTGDSYWIPILDSKKVKLRPNELAGLEFFVTKLRILVDFPSDSHHPIEDIWTLRGFEEILLDLRHIAGDP